MPIRFPLPRKKPSPPAEAPSKRHPLEPTPLDANAYAKKAWTHIKEHEGIPNRIYSDPKGIPTLGAGYALAVRGHDGKYRLRPWDEIGRAINPSKPYAFTEAEKQRLEEAVGYLNGEVPEPDQGRYEKEKKYKEKYDKYKSIIKHNTDKQRQKAQSLIPPLRGKENPEKNHFGFTISEGRAQDLLAEIWPSYRATVLRELRRQARARGWTKAEIDAYIEKYFRNSDLDLALTSLQYNGVSSPNASGAVLDGDLARVREEILYLSNGKTDDNEAVRGGLAKRRRAEADLATDAPEGWSDTAKEAWKRIEDKPGNKAYREDFPDAFAPKPIGWNVSPDAHRALTLARSRTADPTQAILLKSPAAWTEDEVRTVMRGDDYWSHDRFARDRAQARVGAWFRHHYGDDRLRLDSSGRPLRPTPIRAIPETPAPARTADGSDLDEAAEAVVAQVVRSAQDEGLGEAIRKLQIGMNRFGGAGRTVAEDGDYGPETDLRLKEILAADGIGAAETAYHRATLLDLLDGALQSGTIDTVLPVTADAAGTGIAAELAKLASRLRPDGTEAFVRDLSDAQVGAATVHVRAHIRNGGKVSAYDRAAPGM
ncbi:conserved hypothetical protein [uncultured Alphaproteobacteria bacterium]|uniref:Uncharacterized protein n=1 Tax=uncultured Alphaproteobacteria bacterium TaxID=91750 RepID=A0A212JKW2_9PROT|nr:conserved hypothetical protein [uncultured Alphaproteobacteria bacterium]